MGIVFTCEYCGKKIEAPDNAGGRWGKCPACHNRLYIPKQDTTEEEELKLAPIDERDVAKQKQLLAEAYKLAQQIMDEKEIPGEAAGAPAKAGPEEEVDENELTINIITYLRQMAEGDLDRADGLANKIIRCGRRAAKILDQIACSEVPEPELADIPQQVLSGLIRTLRKRIG